MGGAWGAFPFGFVGGSVVNTTLRGLTVEGAMYINADCARPLSLRLYGVRIRRNLGGPFQARIARKWCHRRGRER